MSVACCIRESRDRLGEGCRGDLWICESMYCQGGDGSVRDDFGLGIIRLWALGNNRSGMYNLNILSRIIQF